MLARQGTGGAATGHIQTQNFKLTWSGPPLLANSGNGLFRTAYRGPPVSEETIQHLPSESLTCGLDSDSICR